MDLKNNINKAINNLENNIANAQEKFMESGLYNVFDKALDTGIRIALPEVVEDVAIDIKDAIFENGLTNGVKQIWNNIKDFGKSVYGIVTGKFDNIDQIKEVTKSGGVLDGLSKIFDFALDKAVDKDKITKQESKSIKTQKNSIIKDIKDNFSESLDKQSTYVEKIQTYNDKWNESFANKDLKGMKSANKNIQKYLNKTIPLENVLKEARKIEIMQNLVESTGSFDITRRRDGIG